MKNKITITILFILFTLTTIGQSKPEKLPVIDMHLHVYSGKSYWGGKPFPLKDTLLTSPVNNIEHLNAVMEQINKYNIVITYASGNYDALKLINDQFPDKFLSSIEVWPTRKLLYNTDFLNTLRTKIKNGEIRGLGEVCNVYTGIAPNDQVMDTLYKVAAEYDLPIGVHFASGPAGAQLNNFPDMRLEYGNPLMIQDVLIKFPKLRINMMHAGLPIFADETFGIMYMFPNVYVDIAVLPWYDEYTKESLKEFLIKAMKYGFGKRILYGSDEMTWPGSIGLSIDFINNADFLTQKQKRDILYNNASKYLRLSNDEIKRHHGKL